MTPCPWISKLVSVVEHVLLTPLHHAGYVTAGKPPTIAENFLMKLLFRILAPGLLLVLAGCSHPAPSAPPEPVVRVLVVHPGELAYTRELVGRLQPTLMAQVNARVTGNVLKRVYTEGSHVQAGQVLFRIDPAPLLAILHERQAALAQARASAENAMIITRRYAHLIQRNLIARQDYDNALATERTTAAAVQQATAQLEAAKLNLSYATVRAPIAGRAGLAKVTVGALVSAAMATPMTTIERINPLYAYFSEPYPEVEKLRQAQATGKLKPVPGGKPLVQIVLPNGHLYTQAGRLDFTDMAVNPQTGTVQLRAIVANPKHQLLPGLFVTIRLNMGSFSKVYRVPQAAVLRNQQGPYLFILGVGNKVAMRRIKLGLMEGSDWIVTRGLHNGERVIIDGVQKVRPGKVARVTAAPTKPAARR